MRPRTGLAVRLLARLKPAQKYRYIKFGLVGASGTAVNIALLYSAQELLLTALAPPSTRLYASLALAITGATVNNFIWNRRWTWADRRLGRTPLNPQAAPLPQQFLRVGAQFGRYALACWLGMALQYGLTLWLARSMHYVLANVLAILFASVGNFLLNDRWTFRR